MTNSVAILIGVSEYNSALFDNLPACVNDVGDMHDLLSASKRFDDIIPLKNPTANQVQEKLKALAADGRNYGDILIYFSGHGTEDANEFYWVTKDFNDKNPNVTGVSRTNLIEILRAIKADHKIIIQDACHSGQALLKQARNMPYSELGDVLFISSSSASEKTPAGVVLSPFTDKFIESACRVKTQGKVDYQDIINALKDKYLPETEALPHVAGQSSISVSFCDDAAWLETIRDKYKIDEAEAGKAEDIPVVTQASDIDVLNGAEKALILKEDAQNKINQSMDEFEAAFKKQSDLVGFFKARSVVDSDYYHVTDLAPIVRRVQKMSHWDEFVTAEVVRKKARKSSMLGTTAWLFDSMYEPEYFDSFHLTNNSNLEAVHQRFYLEPTAKLLCRHVLELVIIPGLLEVSVFWRLGKQGRADWSGFAEDSGMQGWQHSQYNWDGYSLERVTGLLRKLFEQAAETRDRTINNLRNQS